MVLESKHLRADERRDLTVRTVVDLAAEQNPSEITTAAIAKRMNVTQGALFRHFPNKDAILEAVVDWVADRLLRRLDEAAAGASGALDALEAMFMAHIEFIVLHPAYHACCSGNCKAPDQHRPNAWPRHC